MTYTAIIADIYKSRKLSKDDRKRLQSCIKEGIDVLNYIFKPCLQFDVVFSAGDEVQGLFKNPWPAYLYFRLFRMILWPYHIKCGIGQGEWEVKINGGTSPEQDGSAYHYARYALSMSEKTNKDILFMSNTRYDLYINTLIDTSSLLLKKQTTQQNNIYLLAELINPFFDEKTMIIKNYNKIFSIVEKRIEKAYNINKGKNFLEYFLDFEPFNIFYQENSKNRLFFDKAFKKGLSNQISGITKTSRQNIENILKAGLIAQIRSIDATIATLLKETF